MNRPTQEFERLALDRKLDHAGNPLLRWEMTNVELRYDPAGNIKIDKGHRDKKVDGIVSAVMALDGCMEIGESRYEREEVRVL